MNVAVPFSLVYFAVSFLEIVFLQSNAILNNLTTVHKYPVFSLLQLEHLSFSILKTFILEKLKFLG